MEKTLEAFYETLQVVAKVCDACKQAERNLEANYKKDIQNANIIVQKAQRAQEKLEDIEQRLAKEKNRLTKEIEQLYKSFGSDTEGIPTHQSVLQVAEREERKSTDLQTELAEKKERQKESQFVRKVLQLQQATLPLQVDVNSTKDHFKGFIKRPCGKIDFIEHDMTKSDSVMVADELWGS